MMEAGPEMNKAIAEMMGYTVYHYDKDVRERCYYMLMDASWNPAVFGWHDGERRTEAEAWNDCPHFSTDWTAAGELVEYMRERGLSIACSNHGDGWMVEVIEGPVVFAETFPEAICRAAMTAVPVR